MNTNQEIAIKKYLPENLREAARNFRINEEYLEAHGEIITLVIRSRSIDTDTEKQSRFDLLGLMNEEQIEKLHDILMREKEKLEAIEQKYEEKKIAIKKKYLLKRQNMGYQKTMSKIKNKEATHREQEQAEADALLDNI